VQEGNPRTSISLHQQDSCTTVHSWLECPVRTILTVLLHKIDPQCSARAVGGCNYTAIGAMDAKKV
jgi:hypothetical protein